MPTLCLPLLVGVALTVVAVAAAAASIVTAVVDAGANVRGHEQVAVAQAETSRLKAAAVRAAAEKTSLEQAADELEAKCRAAIAAEEDSRYVNPYDIRRLHVRAVPYPLPSAPPPFFFLASSGGCCWMILLRCFRLAIQSQIDLSFTSAT